MGLGWWLVVFCGGVWVGAAVVLLLAACMRSGQISRSLDG
jgi:hypothetical protein